MYTMTRSLLSEYYGFGSEGYPEKSFSIHGGVQSLEILPEEIEVSITKQLDDETDDNASETNQKENENLASFKLDAKKPNMEQREKSSRFLSEEISSTIEDGDDASYEIFLETNAALNDYIFEEKSTIKRDESLLNTDKTQLLKPAEDISDINLVPFELETPEIVRSNISSPMPRKRSNRKIKTSVMPLPPPPKKVPLCNGVFLDLTSTGISDFPLNMLDKLSDLKMLYLENNNLNELPLELFTVLKSLNWLDARNNRLTNLPSTIARHPSLETILLQGNRIEKLPLELCLVPQLKGLQTMGNPLVFPPKDIVSQGCEAILNHLRKEWQKLNPEEVANKKRDFYETGDKDERNKKVKPDLNTILCYKPNNNSSSVLKKRNLNLKKKMTASRDQLPEISSFASSSSSAGNTDEKTVRQKSWDYKPNNRCLNQSTNITREAIHFTIFKRDPYRCNVSSEGDNVSTAMRLMWISKVKEMLGKQALALQRMKDREALNDWRKDKSSFHRSIEKASKRSAEEIPFAVDLNDIPWISKQDLTLRKNSKKSIKGKRGMVPPINMNKKIEELFESLSRLQVTRQMDSLSPRTEQKLLEVEIRKISNLQDEIQMLKYCNDVAMAPPIEGQNTPRKQIQRPPPIII